MNAEQKFVVDSARSNLIAYCKLMEPKFEAPDHLVELAKILHEVELGKTKRVIVTFPPRHGKSELVSRRFPAWYFGRHPDKFVIEATYGQDLASDFGRKVRDQLTDPFFQFLFPECEIRGDSQAAHRFSTDKGGEYFAVGVGGPITGRGAHLLIIDDPIKNREDADSDVVRTKINEWYTSTAYTRLMPGGSIIIIMTRWHEEDLVGHVLKNHQHENWEIIDFPAIADEGTPGESALWTERYPLHVLKTIKATLPFYDWSCLYQQNPVPKEGNLIKAEWIQSGLPENGDIAATFMAIDPAISKKETADETAFSVWGVSYGSVPKFYEIETVYGHFDFQEILSIGETLFNKHKLTLFGCENVAFQRVLGDEFTRKGLPCVQLAADTDKVRRAMSVSHFFSQGRCFVNTPKLKDQLLRFRGVDGDADDLADAAFHCLRLIRDNSDHPREKPKNRYKGMDPRSEMFWRNHFNEMPGQVDRGDHLINSL